MCDYLPFLLSVELRDGEVIKEYKLYDGDNKRYFVSNYGDRIYSLCGNEVIQLAIDITEKGYYYTTFQNNTLLNPRDKRPIHQIVAELFCDNPYKGQSNIEVHHKTFDKSKNSYKDLEYLPQQKHREEHTKHRRELKKQQEQEAGQANNERV